MQSNQFVILFMVLTQPCLIFNCLWARVWYLSDKINFSQNKVSLHTGQNHQNKLVFMPWRSNMPYLKKIYNYLVIFSIWRSYKCKIDTKYLNINFNTKKSIIYLQRLISYDFKCRISWEIFKKHLFPLIH